MKKLFLLFISVFAIICSTKAQENFEVLLFANQEDANRLTESYFNPAMKGLIYGMNSGWYHTAEVHSVFGFDFSFGVNASLVPTEDEMFSLTGLKSINQLNGKNITSASIAGSENNGSNATVNFKDENSGITYVGAFKMPGGIKEDLPVNAVPTPTAQLNLGLPGKFEIGVRLIPKIGQKKVRGDLFGVSLKKEITSWFGPMDKLPLHVSLMGTYTNMAIDYTIEDDNASDNMTITDGLAELRLKSYTVQALASLNFPIINIYAGFGYSAGESTLRVLGKYEIDYQTSITSRELKDPLDLGFNASSFRTTAGLRLSLGFFKIYGDFTLQEYNTVSAGIAFSFF